MMGSEIERKENMLEVSLLIGLVAVACVSLALWGAGWISGVVVSRKHRRRAAALPPITVLKPVKGETPGLRQNLEAIVRQDHPAFEVIVCAEDPADPALRVAHDVKRRFPHVRMRVLNAPPPFGMNPKVRSLAFMERFARHDRILVSDVDTRPAPHYLRTLAAQAASENSDFVHSLLVGVGEDSVSAAAESAQFGLWVTQSMAAARMAKHVCVVGKSMLYRREAFAELGGWRRFRDSLSDDYLVGRAFQEHGLRVSLSTYAVPVYTAKRTCADFMKRHIRWGQLRKSSNRLAYACEPLQNTTLCLGVVAVGGGLMGSVEGAWLAAFASSAWLFRFIMDWFFLSMLRGHALSLRHAAALPLRDALSFAAWAMATARTTVDWQGNLMRLRQGAVLEPLDQHARYRDPKPELA
jgi:ceramide glucosyltransferase